MILSIETSTEVCSVALHENSKVLSYYELFTEKSHSSALTLLIKNVIENTQKKLSDLQGILLSQGPGSYTGLRVGTSVAKGLCYALDIPLFAVDTLLAMIHTAKQMMYLRDEVLFCPMIDARRDEVFTMLADSQLHILKPTEALILTQDSLAKELAEKTIVIFGDGADKAKRIISHSNLIFLKNIYPSAKAIGDLFFLQKAQQVDVAYFEPFYLKEVYTKVKIPSNS
ncbi:tRNA (adenosine(37)-N6)-threonylcarbamoyltransferase complex dimerization subunit type 1 TsaB [Thermoflexibacter ruber]|uniref:tRNA threonylcarbamoyladenosine biosynthesis protein TsaB n=1 Tax=Thermoflexibacter ruber TaxID=1003 RepID=A0A1I2D8S0_9BACT|nr:tRNA (adenosine(37)-N6)-threonylcarbamoyltransferase complex dimerization subunit type 1 TsaB [Thermoflexibacter ruber]SFE76503.1 tRNA threonylcarbamoyladenosine biosynthesis protein TsaB [Thermoflexibacter ruber]